MILPIFVLLGVFGGILAVPESIDQKSLAELNGDSFGMVGASELMHIGREEFLYPDFHADFIYGGLSWDSFRPRIAVADSAHGDFWTGAGVDYEKYWSINKDQAVFVGMSFLPGYYKAATIQLGSEIEFRTQIEVGLVQKNNWRVSVYIEHRSNASIGRINPGVEAVGANFGLAL
jgi:lipid A 3-O-deacylase PagL